MEENTEVFVITEQSLQEKIYIIRGQKVMLDFDLAEIYGYETKNFNRQVKNNQQKFEGDDFMFQLSDEEVEELSRCKNFTLNRGIGRGSNIKYKPYVFTEQGIYMLMTVLRGELAVKQSRALVRTFKLMKDYILDNRELICQREYIQLSMQTAENVRDISKLKSDMGSIEKQMSDVMDQLKEVVTKSDLAYSEVYGQAKKTIFVVDNYIGLRTLVLLKNAMKGVAITLFSDNVGSRLHSIEYSDFCREYPFINITLRKTGGIYHDRFIVLDYDTDDERIFLCGASSKDAGARVTSIVEDFGIEKYKVLIDELLKNPTLTLT